ncbi:glucosaminylphosphatidylinositol acyltransferase [Pancytospora philotis]|nr:glucosaminylphosphatidylinositol acyltransferase [Pancytospora philotis]
MLPERIMEVFAVTTLPLLGLAALSRPNDGYVRNFICSAGLQYAALSWPRAVPWLCALLLPLCVQRCRTSGPKAVPATNLGLHLNRALIMLPVVICIFMCDFALWTPRFGKTDGMTAAGDVGLMDTGVGAFIFNAGLFSTKVAKHRRMRTVSMLLLLGLVRLGVVTYFGFHVNPREYGLHLNFYFILAFIHLLYHLFNSRYNVYLGLLLLAAHEYAIKRLGPVILSEDRSNIFLQNKEGLFSVVPHFACYLIASYVGSTVVSTLPIRNKLFYNFVYFKCALAAFIVAFHYRPVSRILCSLSFSTFNLLLGIYGNTICLLVSKYFAEVVGELPLMLFISRNMMLVFLFSNLLVMLFKLVPALQMQSRLVEHLYNLAYLALNFLLLPGAARLCKLPWIKV